MGIFGVLLFKGVFFWWVLVRWEADFWWDFLVLFQGISSLFGFSCIIFFGLFMLINGCFFLVTFVLFFWSIFLFLFRLLLFSLLFCFFNLVISFLSFALFLFFFVGFFGISNLLVGLFFPCIGILELGEFWLRFAQSFVFWWAFNELVVFLRFLENSFLVQYGG